MTRAGVLAVDGGNSKTDVALVNADGEVLALVRGALSSPQHLGVDGALAVVEGLLEEAPFDRILVTAGAPAVPAALEAQLAAGGRLVIPVGPSGYQHLTTITRREDNAFDRIETIGCVFVPLIGKQGWPG